MIGFVIAAAVMGAAPADPLGPAKQGLVQCYAPDLARKTCRSIGSYEVRADGTILNTATVLVARQPLVVMQTASTVEVLNGAICGKVAQVDIDKATFTLDGAPLDEERAASLRTALTGAMSSVIGHEVCTAYAADGDMLAGQVSVDGERRPTLDQKVMWVSPAEYRVGP